MSSLAPVTVAYGDGIGPEIMEASLHVIEPAGNGKPGYTLAQGQ